MSEKYAELDENNIVINITVGNGGNPDLIAIDDKPDAGIGSRYYPKYDIFLQAGMTIDEFDSIVSSTINEIQDKIDKCNAFKSNTEAYSTLKEEGVEMLDNYILSLQELLSRIENGSAISIGMFDEGVSPLQPPKVAAFYAGV